MSLSITHTPGIINPAYNTMYFNVYAIEHSTQNFAWTSDLTILGSKKPKPGLTLSDFVSEDLGSYIKQPTNGIDQWWDPSRVAQTFLTYNFIPEITCITPSGEECVAFLTNTLSFQNYNTDKTVQAADVQTYVFNGGDDRNDFRNFNTSAIGITQVDKPYNYIPNVSKADQSRFLTHFNERTVDLNDTGTLSCLNGIFSAQTEQYGTTSITATTDAFEFTTYKNGAQVLSWTMVNPYRNNPAYNALFGQHTRFNRVDIPAYPKNLDIDSTSWGFYDNYFSAGHFSMISTTPHGFEVGDVIYVNQDPGYTNASYQGSHIVNAVPSPFIVETSTPWGVSTPAEGGTAIKIVPDGCRLDLVDNTQIQYTAVTDNGSGYAVFHIDPIYDVSNIVPACWLTTTASALYPTDGTNTPTGQQETATYDFTTPNTIVSNMTFSGNESGFLLLRQRIPSSTQTFFGDIDEYKVQFTWLNNDAINNFWAPYGDGVTFKIEGRCGKHDRIELFWLNKLGAFDSMLFKGKNTKSIDFIKETYTKRLGDQAYSPYIYNVIDYKTTDFEKQNFNGYQDTKFTVSTGWISEMEGDRVIECMGSNVVYMYKDGVFIPVVATVQNVDVKTKDNEKLIYYTISLDLTYNTLSQRR